MHTLTLWSTLMPKDMIKALYRLTRLSSMRSSEGLYKHSLATVTWSCWALVPGCTSISYWWQHTEDQLLCLHFDPPVLLLLHTPTRLLRLSCVMKPTLPVCSALRSVLQILVQSVLSLGSPFHAMIPYTILHLSLQLCFAFPIRKTESDPPTPQILSSLYLDYCH